LNINGKNGPTLKKEFSCEGCKWLGADYGIIPGKKCLHNSKIFGNKLYSHLKTPFWCPFLLTKIRNEKLKEIENKN